MARRNKPQAQPNPAQQRRQNFEALGLQAEAADLIQNADIAITRQADERDGKKVDHNVAKRWDAFDALRGTFDAGCYDAARRFERDVLVSQDAGDRGRKMVRVDNDQCDDREFARTLASQSLDLVKRRLPHRDWWLLNELVNPPIDRGNWRAHVHYITGEDNPSAQAACVRASCLNLRDVYEALEGRKAA